RAFPWSERTLSALERLKGRAPKSAAPRSIDPAEPVKPANQCTVSVADAAHVLDLVEQDLAMNRDWALRARAIKTRRTAPRRLNSWRRDLGGARLEARLEARPAAEPVDRTQPAEQALEAVPTVKTATMGDILLHRIRSVGQSASERRRALERNTDGA
ncbi:MAG: hypothetical protein AAFZ06_07650, partial [Pseudomonadota bacterium]